MRLKHTNEGAALLDKGTAPGSQSSNGNLSADGCGVNNAPIVGGRKAASSPATDQARPNYDAGERLDWLLSVASNPNLSRSALRTAIGLQSFDYGEGIFPRVSQVTAKTGQPARSVHDGLRQLESAGHIHRQSGKAVGKSNTYHLLRDDAARPRLRLIQGGHGARRPAEAVGRREPAQRSAETSRPGLHIAADRTLLLEFTESSQESMWREAFWKVYPRKVGKKAALKAADRAVKAGEVTWPLLIAAVERYATEREGQDERYTAHPATWINAGRYADEPTRRAVTIYKPNGQGRPNGSLAHDSLGAAALERISRLNSGGEQ